MTEKVELETTMLTAQNSICVCVYLNEKVEMRVVKDIFKRTKRSLYLRKKI
jgi:hypothetical protein